MAMAISMAMAMGLITGLGKCQAECLANGQPEDPRKRKRLAQAQAGGLPNGL